MTTPRLHRASSLTLLTLLTLGLVALASRSAEAGDKPAPPHMVSAAASSPLKLTSGPTWAELQPGQRAILQSLAGHWSTMDDAGRDKWVNVANRFPHLSPAEKQRMQERMGQWAKLPTQERGEARLRFQQTRQLSTDERQQKWAAYQALPEQDRQDLTRLAQRKAKTVYLASNISGPREAKQSLPPAPPTPTSVAAALVKTGAGATTSLITQRPTPPLHQHAGLPKITATTGFVDPVTLLPKKGAQGAAMAALPQAPSSQATGH
ncbi:MAG: DUF3106 domain-containing protein [Aquabacterium sp.]|nr:DUF3106 domain-containing protein [Aquabacterium sp.]